MERLSNLVTGFFAVALLLFAIHVVSDMAYKYAVIKATVEKAKKTKEIIGQVTKKLNLGDDDRNPTPRERVRRILIERAIKRNGRYQ